MGEAVSREDQVMVAAGLWAQGKNTKEVHASFQEQYPQMSPVLVRELCTEGLARAIDRNMLKQQ